MPQYPPVSTLRQSCLNHIVKNIEYWCQEYVDKFLPEGKFIYVLGPFEDLPSLLLEEIIQALKEQRKIRRHHLHLLSVAHLQKMNLSHEHTDLAFILQLAAFKCKHLKVLDMSYCTKVPRKTLKEAIPSFPLLEEIDLSWSNVTDDIMATLGAYAFNLRTLDLNGCTNITDLAIISLCVTVPGPETQKNRFGNCTKLTRLCLFDTMVGPDGVRCAIENLPNLRSLEWVDTVRVLDCLYGRKWDNRDLDSLPQLHLSDLCLEANETIRKDIFELCVKVCPKAYRISLTETYHLAASSLLPLMNLPAIAELNIVGGDDDTFPLGISPLLVHHGETLTKVFLVDLPTGSVEIVAKNCVNLVHLSLIDIAVYRDPPASKKKEVATHKPFSKLRTLKFASAPSETTLSDANLKMLLSSPSLEYFFIRSCNLLTDKLILDVLSKNKLPKLIHWEVEECKNITAAPIKRLLQLRNPLKYLRLWECKKVTRADSDYFKELIRKKKWNIDFEWK